MIPMTTDLLRLTQWLSPAFPVSGYAYSHGLETAMAGGHVTDAASLTAWVRAVLTHGTGPLDVWAIRRSMAGDDPAHLTAILRARAGSPERWQEARDQGAAFCEVTTVMGDMPLDDLPLPVALGVRARGMDAGVVALLFLQGFAGQMVSAAARFLPLGQSTAQTVLCGLHADVAVTAARDEIDPPGSAAVLAELDAMAHVTLQPRIFRT